MRFLEIDPDLVAGAALGCPDVASGEPSAEARDEWLDGLPREEVRDYLKQVLAGEGVKAERTLGSRYAAWQRGRRETVDAPRRTVAELLRNVEEARFLRSSGRRGKRQGSRGTAGRRA